MSRTILNFWLDFTLLIVFLAVLWSTYVIRFVFPPGTAAKDWNLWGSTYDQWTELQFWLISIFGLAVLLHVMLHWTWVCGVITSKILKRKEGARHQWTDGERTVFGVGLLVVIFNVLGLGFAAAVLMIQGPS